MCPRDQLTLDQGGIGLLALLKCAHEARGTCYPDIALENLVNEQCLFMPEQVRCPVDALLFWDAFLRMRAGRGDETCRVGSVPAGDNIWRGACCLSEDQKQALQLMQADDSTDSEGANWSLTQKFALYSTRYEEQFANGWKRGPVAALEDFGMWMNDDRRKDKVQLSKQWYTQIDQIRQRGKFASSQGEDAVGIALRMMVEREQREIEEENARWQAQVRQRSEERRSAERGFLNMVWVGMPLAGKIFMACFIPEICLGFYLIAGVTGQLIASSRRQTYYDIPRTADKTYTTRQAARNKFKVYATLGILLYLSALLMICDLELLRLN